MIVWKMKTAAEREAEKAFKKVNTKTAVSDQGGEQKVFDKNRERPKAERLAREDLLKAKAK